MLCHIVMKENTVLSVAKRSAACEKQGLILLFSAIPRALILAVATEGLEHSTGDGRDSNHG